MPLSPPRRAGLVLGGISPAFTRSWTRTQVEKLAGSCGSYLSDVKSRRPTLSTALWQSAQSLLQECHCRHRDFPARTAVLVATGPVAVAGEAAQENHQTRSAQSQDARQRDGRPRPWKGTSRLGGRLSSVPESVLSARQRLRHMLFMPEINHGDKCIRQAQSTGNYIKSKRNFDKRQG